MKIDQKLVMINVRNKVEAMEGNLTFEAIHQLCVGESNDGTLTVDVDFIDFENMKFMGVVVGRNYGDFGSFKKNMMDSLGFDIDTIMDEACVGIISNQDIKDAKDMF